MAFQAGFNKYASFQASGAGKATTLDIIGWSDAEEVDKLDVTHTGSAGQQAVIAGVFRVNGNVKANWDSAAVPTTDPPKIRAGVKGVLRCSLDASLLMLTIPIMITKINHQSEVNGIVQYNFDYTLDQIIGASMVPFAYP